MYLFLSQSKLSSFSKNYIMNSYLLKYSNAAEFYIGSFSHRSFINEFQVATIWKKFHFFLLRSS